ncbi:MAG: acyl carrier protein [Bacteroidia bacterium]|nr:acyl carrier protein [Bacteroidia bacterium]
MEISTINKDILKFITDNLISSDINLTEDTLLRDIGIDSYSIVEIILFIERKYGLVIPDENLVPENFKTVNALSEVVNVLLK